MDRSPLADTINASNPLLEPHRIPRELEVDDDATPLVQVEPFSGCVGGEQNGSFTAREGLKRGCSLVASQSAVQNSRAGEASLEVEQRVSVLREDNRRLVDAS